MSGLIFISYRRGDDPGSTGRLFERLLAEGFAADQIFMDIDSIAPGIDFIRELHRQVDRSDVLLAVIGKGWLDAREPSGGRRLDNPDDFVRIEIEAALNQDKRVIPVLVQDVPMPRVDELPDGLKGLATRNFVRLSHERFRLDTQVLVKALRDALDDVAAARELAAERARQEAAARQREREQEEAQRRAAAERDAAERARQEKDAVQRAALASLSAEQIAKAEELANWDFIKQSALVEDFRDHLARFPGGICERMARRRLAELNWAALGPERTGDLLRRYVEEFPDSPFLADANRALAEIDQQAAERASAAAASAEATRDDAARATVDAAFAAAVRADEPEAVARFLEDHPDSHRTTEAQALHNSMLGRERAYQAAVAAGVKSGELRAFLDAHPDGRQAAEIRRILAASEPIVPPGLMRWQKAMLAAILGALGLAVLAILLSPPSSPPVRTAQQPVTAPAPAPTPPSPTPTPTPSCPVFSSQALFDVTLNAGFKQPYRRRVSAGGAYALGGCRADMKGYVSLRPDVALRYETPGTRTLTIDVNSSTDTVLAVKDPSGSWHFDDDGGDGTNPRIRFQRAARGRYEIWVGVYDVANKGANADLILSDR